MSTSFHPNKPALEDKVVKPTQLGSQVFQNVVDACPFPLFIADIKDNKWPIVYTNSSFEATFTKNQQTLCGKNFLSILDPIQHNAQIHTIEQAINQQQTLQTHIQDTLYQGEVRWYELTLTPLTQNDTLQYYVGIFKNITHHKHQEKELQHQSTHDHLTGLPNLMLLKDRLSQQIVHAKRHQQMLGVIFLDIDRFKHLSDGIGQNVSHHLLTLIADRLKHSIRGEDTIARVGSDKFVIIITSLLSRNDMIAPLQRINKHVNKPFYVDQLHLCITCTMGISFYPQDAQDVDGLLKNADMAMYQAKSSGRDHFKFFNEEMNEHATRVLTIENSLTDALQNNHFYLNYQPIINLKTNQICSCEALLRWAHPHLGKLAPLEFIPIAEECDMIIPIGEWVMHTACKQLKHWHQLGLYINMSINLSGKQLKHKNIVNMISAAINKHAINPKYITIELTESILMENVDKTIDLLREIKNIGVKLSIDDFGTGYSSLSYLKRFPIDIIKVDQSFIRDITHNHSDKAITKAIIAMAKSLNLLTVAEGIEKKEQLQHLAQQDCDFAQGYYISKPLDTEEMEQFIRKHLPQ